jgi:hypothetical protein
VVLVIHANTISLALNSTYSTQVRREAGDDWKLPVGYHLESLRCQPVSGWSCRKAAEDDIHWLLGLYVCQQGWNGWRIIKHTVQDSFRALEPWYGYSTW